MSLTPETAPPKKLIEVFTELLEDPFVFEPNTTDFSELIADLPDDINELAEKIKTWCQARPQIYNDLSAALSPSMGAEKTGINSSSPDASDLRQEMLENITRLGSPPSTPQPSDSPPANKQNDPDSANQKS
jgi:hypothetical protein